MMNLPTPTEIEYFLEMAQTQNMSRAAERLGIRQPTLSVALAKLEQTVGSQLFTRTKKGVALTEAGEIFLAKSQELLQVWKGLTTQTREQSQSVRGHLRLGCHVSVALYTLSLFVPQILKEHPDLEFSFEHDFSRKITEAVISLKLDLGIVINPVQHPDLIIKKLNKDEVAFWKSEKLDRSLETVLIGDQNLLQTQALLQRTKKAQSTFTKYVTTSSLEVARDLAQSGAGVAILPTRVAEMAPKPYLKKIAGLPTLQDEICLIYRAERRSSRTIQFLSERIQKVFNKQN
jgi:DNA-binding transcriptional LysR family regulator